MTGLAPIITATIDYEAWLSRQVDVVEADLHLKHRQMASSLFAFLRATFYRWGPLWRETCPDLVETPRVLAVGDLHVENFGTWRDKEGRLVWGVNDFDEYYSNLAFIYTPRIKFGILRLGAQWERYSFGYPDGGQQLPNTLQSVNAIVGLDTRLGDSLLIRFEAQPGFYGTAFDHLDGNAFNIPFVLGGDGQIFLNRSLANWQRGGCSAPYTKRLVQMVGEPILPNQMWHPDAVLRVEDIEHAPITIDRVDKAAAVQMVFEPDMAGYSACSMITNPASASGRVGGRMRLAQVAG